MVAYTHVLVLVVQVINILFQQHNQYQVNNVQIVKNHHIILKIVNVQQLHVQQLAFIEIIILTNAVKDVHLHNL